MNKLTIEKMFLVGLLYLPIQALAFLFFDSVTVSASVDFLFLVVDVPTNSSGFSLVAMKWVQSVSSTLCAVHSPFGSVKNRLLYSNFCLEPKLDNNVINYYNIVTVILLI